MTPISSIFTATFCMFVVCLLIHGTDSRTTFLLVKMTQQEKQKWVDTHNYWRRKVNPSAANMKLMTWDEELAAVSETTVATCNFMHTAASNRPTSVFHAVGENLYAGSLYIPKNMAELKSGVTAYWYSEEKDYNYASRSCSASMCGHYTQVVWAKSYKVGCAIGMCTQISGGYGQFLVACSYGPAGNYVYYGVPDPPYISGTACSRCDEGDSCTEGLCSNAGRDNPATSPVTTTAPTTSESTTHATADTTTIRSTTVSTTTKSITNAPTTNWTIPPCHVILNFIGSSKTCGGERSATWNHLCLLLTASILCWILEE